MEPFREQIEGLESRAGVRMEAEAASSVGLQAGSGRTMSSCAMDQGHLQSKVSPCCFLLQPLFTWIPVHWEGI